MTKITAQFKVEKFSVFPVMEKLPEIAPVSRSRSHFNEPRL